MITTGSATATRRRRRAWKPEMGGLSGLLLALPLLILLALLLVVPVILLFNLGFVRTDGFAQLFAYFESPARRRVLRITFVDSALVAFICVVLGGIVAWTLVRTHRRTTKIFLWAGLLLPFLMGTITKLYALTILFEANGIINRLLRGIGLIDSPLKLLYNQFAVVAGMVYQLLPFAVLPLLAGFYTFDLNFLQAARSLGASRIKALFTVLLPLTLPSLFASFIIVFVISTGFFLTPVLLGGSTSPFSASLIEQGIFVYYDLEGAVLSALILLVGSLIAVGVAYLLVGGKRLAKAVVA